MQPIHYKGSLIGFYSEGTNQVAAFDVSKNHLGFYLSVDFAKNAVRSRANAPG